MEPKCILNDPNLEIISETDHKLGLCLCSLCTCGTHTCVSRRFFLQKSPKIQSSYLTQYIKPPNNPHPASPRSISPPTTQKFTGFSTYKRDFPRYDCTPKPRRSEFPQKKTFTLTTLRSAYMKDFIRFKTTEKLENYSPKAKGLDTSSFKFQESTTYKNNFLPHKQEIVRSVKGNPAKIFVDPNQYMESTHKREFRGERAFDSEMFVRNEIEVKLKNVGAVSSSRRDYKEVKSPIRSIPRRIVAINKYINDNNQE